MKPGEQGYCQIIEIKKTGRDGVNVRSYATLLFLDGEGYLRTKLSGKETMTQPIEVANNGAEIQEAIAGLVRSDVAKVFVISPDGKCDEVICHWEPLNKTPQ
ncbi:MAG: hypothetical protein WCV72_01535 [Patescibacteria group bacterium]|jgi:hypothetical protein